MDRLRALDMMFDDTGCFLPCYCKRFEREILDILLSKKHWSREIEAGGVDVMAGKCRVGI